MTKSEISDLEKEFSFECKNRAKFVTRARLTAYVLMVCVVSCREVGDTLSDAPRRCSRRAALHNFGNSFEDVFKTRPQIKAEIGPMFRSSLALLKKQIRRKERRTTV